MRKSCQRGETDLVAFLTTIVLLPLVVWGLGSLIGFNFGFNENEGIVNSDDCRQTIMLKERDWDTYFHKFVCSYRKTNKGTIMDGYCVSIEMNKGVCEKAYVYQKKPQANCSNPKFPYLGVDDMCHNDPQ